MPVEFHRHSLGAADAARVAAVLETPFLTTGSVCREVEQKLCGFFDVPHAVLTNSWTNGALATLLALGIGRGDEVIVPAMTFIATANVVELLGARPVIIDVDPDTLLITPAAVAAALTPRTRCVIPVHLYGQMCDMPAMAEALAGRPDVALIEDCAHCFEGTRGSERPGRHSDAAIFSFYATKNVTCGEGGAVITRREDLYRRLLATRLHGMSAGASERFRAGQYNHWDMVSMGVKANLPDLLACLLPPQIDTVLERLELRRDVASRYRAALDGHVRLPRQEAGIVSAEHLFAIGVPGWARDRVISMLNESGIKVTVNYRAIHTTQYYRDAYDYRPEDFPVANTWGEQTLSLPLYPGISRADQDEVIEAVLRVLASIGDGPDGG